MNRSARRSAAAILLLVSSGGAACGGGHHVQTGRMGAVYPPKPPACGLRFENLTYQEASSKYEMLGLVTVTGMDSPALTDPVKRDVEREACAIGADAVTLNVGVPNALQFAAWRAR